MQSTQKLTRAFRALVDLVEEEAARNPAFARRLEAAVADLPAGPTNKKHAKSKASAEEIEVPDVLKVFQDKGEPEFRFWLRDFDLATLKAIVKANGFDPGKNSQRWTEPDKFIALIVEQTLARLRRGSAFLPPKTDGASTTTDSNLA
jgi:hypothetical protein